MLASLSNRTHAVHTAFALSHRPGVTGSKSEPRRRFASIGSPHDEIAQYVSTGEPYDKAGGYGIQGRAAALVERIDGDFYTVDGIAARPRDSSPAPVGIRASENE